MPGKFIKTMCLAMVLIFTVLLPVNALAANDYNLTIRGNPFKDTNTGHWAFKDIVKMNIRNVVSGYDDGSFQPGKPVSQIEAVLMAVHNMGVETQLSLIDTSQPLPVSVPGWVESGSKKEVLYAIQKGLIVPAENNFNAVANASRAWVTQLMVRMVNKDAEASQLSNQAPAVKDAGAVPEWAVGYVNAAFKYNLMSGYPDNTFKPNQPVTRAEMVSLLSRGEQYLDLGEKVMRGKIVGLAGETLTLTVNDNPKELRMDPDCWVFNAQGQTITSNSLQKDDVVKVVVSGTSVKYLEALPPDVVVSTIRGTVLHVLPQEKVIVIKDEKQTIHTKSLSNIVNFSAQNGSIDNLSQIGSGNQVELGLNADGYVSSVLLLNGAQAGSNSGIIVDIYHEQKLIIIKNSAGKLNSYQYSDQVTVKIAGQRFPTIEDLQVGDEVQFTVTSGTVTEIELVLANQQLTLTGKVMLISPEKRILTVQKDDGSLEAFSVSEGATIHISGLNFPQLTNVLVNDMVELTVEKGQVVSITIKDRGIVSTVKGTVAAVDTTNRIITLKTEKDDLKTYEVKQNAEFALTDRTSRNIYDLKKDMKVEIELVDNMVVYLEVKNAVEGSVISLEQSRRLITLKVDNSGTRSYTLSGNVDVDIEGDSGADLNDVSNNDYVEIRMENDVVTKINVRKVLTYQVTGVYKSSNELKVKEDDGDTRYLSLNGRITLVVPGVSSPDIEDLAVGDIVRATFLGNKLTKVEVAPANRGKVTAVNSVLNTVTVQSFAGAASTYTFDTNCEVLNGGQKYYNVNAIMVGDRVEVKEKADGGMTFSIMKKVSGTFQSYTDDGSKIYISKDPITWLNYIVSANVYVHSGNQTITLRNLAKDNSIDVYLLDDMVYEIEKK